MDKNAYNRGILIYVILLCDVRSFQVIRGYLLLIELPRPELMLRIESRLAVL
jgi:hypothetical protein